MTAVALAKDRAAPPLTVGVTGNGSAALGFWLDDAGGTSVSADAAASVGCAGADAALADDDLTEAEITRLAALPSLQYDRERFIVAKRFGVRVGTLDGEVSAARKQIGGSDGKQGSAIQLPEPEPWHEPVEGDALLASLSSHIRRYVVMDERAADAVALWAIHTYLLDATNITPRLAVVSPEKRCGKTTLLDVLAHLARRSLKAANLSTAVAFRVVERVAQRC